MLLVNSSNALQTGKQLFHFLKVYIITLVSRALLGGGTLLLLLCSLLRMLLLLELFTHAVLYIVHLPPYLFGRLVHRHYKIKNDLIEQPQQEYEGY